MEQRCAPFMPLPAAPFVHWLATSYTPRYSCAWSCTSIAWLLDAAGTPAYCAISFSFWGIAFSWCFTSGFQEWRCYRGNWTRFIRLAKQPGQSHHHRTSGMGRITESKILTGQSRQGREGMKSHCVGRSRFLSTGLACWLLWWTGPLELSWTYRVDQYGAALASFLG